MSINDLDLILKKDPIISTWPARALVETPAKVEHDYEVHARTHISLGDTSKYVDIAFKWVSGQNKGAFIGAVLGDYGEGKTSFLVHLWHQSREQQVFTIPPFEWDAFEQIVDAVAGWTSYILEREGRSSLVAQVNRLHERFRSQTAEQLAKDVARDSQQAYEAALATVSAVVASGRMHLSDMSAHRLLEFVADLTAVVLEAGYKGLLVLLDEPEVAAKKLGTDTVQFFLFNLANELKRADGNYGVFLSMPQNFHATTQARFAALTARLEARNCFPRLGDIYGPSFAQDLWQRYAEEFQLGSLAGDIVSPLALEALGQIGASESKELSFGPRTVVGAFRRVVDRYQTTSQPYQPQDLVEDILDQEISVKDEYRSRVRSALRSPDITEENDAFVRYLAAFPLGLRSEVLRELDMYDGLVPLSRSGGVVHRSAFTMGLRSLRRSDGGGDSDPLREIIEDIDAEYAPGRKAFSSALEALARDIVPMVLRPRQGQQLDGWKELSPLKKVSQGAYLGTYLGAFEQTVSRFPYRAAIVVVNGLGERLDHIDVPELDGEGGPQTYDLLLQFEVRWNEDQELPGEVVELREDPEGRKPCRIRLVLDLTRGTVHQDYLAEAVGADRPSPMWVLNLLNRLRDVKDMPRMSEQTWAHLRRVLIEGTAGLLLGDQVGDALIEQVREKLGESLTSSGAALIGSVANVLLARRYPDYVTLIRQPHWQSKVDQYVNALTNDSIPLSSKRGQEPWQPDDATASRVLKANRMNLTGGAYGGFEHLIEIRSRGRTQGLEVVFKIHPLEDKIRQQITEQPTDGQHRLKREGKECWYVSQAELLPIILSEGYTVEELHKIIAMGKARKSFDVTEHRGERVLYTMPLDPEELRDQLRAKLRDLLAEIEEYRRLSDYHTKLDADAIKKNIEKVEDDSAYESLKTRMNKEFEQNHSRLPGYFDRLHEELDAAGAKATQAIDRLKGREVTQLAIPESKSPWGADLGRYIVTNLKTNIDEVRTATAKLVSAIDAAKQDYTFSQQRTPPENLALLLEGQALAQDYAQTGKSLLEKVGAALKQAQEYGDWRRVLASSDTLYESLLGMQSTPDHKAKADELIAEFDQLSARISEHIQIRNLTGLAHHKQYAKMIEDLEKKRLSYIAGLKTNFDQCKGRVAVLLERLSITERARAAFDQTSIAESYRDLFDTSARLIRDAISQVAGEMEQQRRELAYALNVLGTVQPETADPMLAQLEEKGRALLGLRDSVAWDYLRALVEKDAEGEALLLSQLEHGREVAREARKLVQTATKPTDPEMQSAVDVLHMIPDAKPIDLKDVVLHSIGNGSDPTHALDACLEGLVELFKHNRVQIKVERRGR
jgi:hypothetical protein